MHPLTPDDLLSHADYLSRRREFFDAHRRYRDRYRRVRIGPQVSLLFENRQTLWFRVHEFLRLARLVDPNEVQQHLNWFNTLLPRPQVLQAAFVLDIDEEANWYREFDYWRDLKGAHLRLWLGETRIAARLATARHEDRSLGIAHWLEFELGKRERLLLADASTPMRFEIEYKRYACFSAHVGDDVRQSLMDDLDMAARANAA